MDPFEVLRREQSRQLESHYRTLQGSGSYEDRTLFRPSKAREVTFGMPLTEAQHERVTGAVVALAMDPTVSVQKTCLDVGIMDLETRREILRRTSALYDAGGAMRNPLRRDGRPGPRPQVHLQKAESAPIWPWRKAQSQAPHVVLGERTLRPYLFALVDQRVRRAVEDKLHDCMTIARSVGFGGPQPPVIRPRPERIADEVWAELVGDVSRPGEAVDQNLVAALQRVPRASILRHATDRAREYLEETYPGLRPAGPPDTMTIMESQWQRPL